jgi:uncharacterized protein YbjT (DUF2867 family)
MTAQVHRRTRNTLVIGGTGKTGRRVVQQLSSLDSNVRIGSRSAEVPFDWTSRATWLPALRDVESIYISYYPDLAVPGAVDDVQELVDLAVKSGIRRLVLLSGRGEDEALRAEKVVQASGVEWTIVRSAWFNQNFSENYLLEPIQHGEVALPVSTVPEPFVDADDIASVAVAALTEDGHSGEVYEVTGPRLLTFEQAIQEIAQAAGRSIRFAEVSLEEYSSMLEHHGVPAEFVGLLIYLFSEVLDGRNASLSDGVQRALGRDPRDFADYARDAAATGVWSVRR